MVTNGKDKVSGTDRGFVLLMQPEYDSSKKIFGPSLLFRLDRLPDQVDQKLASFVTKWDGLLDEEVPIKHTLQDITALVTKNLLCIIKSMTDSKLAILDMTLVHFRNRHAGRESLVARCQRPQSSKSCPNVLFYQQLESLELFKMVKACLATWTDQEQLGQVLDLVSGHLEGIDQAVNFAKYYYYEADMASPEEFFKGTYCPGYIELFPEHIVTLFLLVWPYFLEEENALGQKAFLPILREYELVSQDCQSCKESESVVDKDLLNDETQNVSSVYERSEGDNRDIRKQLSTIVAEDFLCLKNTLLVKQIQALRNKFMIILKYYSLLK